MHCYMLDLRGHRRCKYYVSHLNVCAHVYGHVYVFTCMCVRVLCQVRSHQGPLFVDHYVGDSVRNSSVFPRTRASRGHYLKRHQCNCSMDGVSLDMQNISKVRSTVDG